MKTDKHSVMVGLTPEEYEALKELADADDRTVASYVRRIIRKALAENGEQD